MTETSRPSGPSTDGSVTRSLLDLARRIQTVDRFARSDLAEFTIATTDDPAERAAANLVLALKQREAGHSAAAEQLLRSCVSDPEADHAVVTFAGLRLVGLLAYAGRVDEAEEILVGLEARQLPSETASILVERAFVTSSREQHVLALTQWRRAIDLATESGDEVVEMMARCGYARDLTEMNSLNEAEFQMRQVLLARGSGDRIRIQGNHHLGLILAHKGEIAESLRRLEHTASARRDRPWAACRIAITRTEALLSCRLLDEAEGSADVAIVLARRMSRTQRAESLVMRARVAIAARQLAPALADLSAALELFEQAGSARGTERTKRVLRALDPEATPDFPLEAIMSDTSLVEALYLTINRSERPDDTIPYLQTIALAVRSDSIRQRVLGLSAAVQLELLLGEVERADTLVDELLDAGDLMCDGIGSVEMRSNIFFDLSGIDHIALALAQHADPVRYFQLLDAVAASIHSESIATAFDTDFLRQLEALREATRPSRPSTIDLRTSPAVSDDRCAPSAAAEATTEAEAAAADALAEEEFAALEQRIRFVSRRVEASSMPRLERRHWLDYAPPSTPTASFLVASNVVWRCYSDGTNARLERLCPLTDIDRVLRRFRFAFDLAVNGAHPWLGFEALRRAGDALHDLLLDGLPADGRGLTLRLHRFLTEVPWRLLHPPSSGRTWVNPGVPQRVDRRSMPRLDRVAIIVGPDLGQPALDEAAAIAAIHPGARILSGEDATVERTLEALERADLVHLAGHGLPHPDDPLLASVGLHDGPLTAYDLESLRSAPAVVVLAACGLGASGATGRGSAYGLPGVLLRRGTLSVIGSPMWIDNALTSLVMPDLHRSLADGAAPVDALAALPNGDQKRDLTALSLISMQAGPLRRHAPDPWS